MLVLMMPMIILLSACGATPSNEALGVKFVSNMYDEETGYAIFEVDLLEQTELKYKVMPSSWGGYTPTFIAVDEGGSDNLIKAERRGNKIYVKDETFKEIRIKVTVNGYSDICIVRLKKYPVDIYLEETNVAVNANGTYTINPIGVFEEKERDSDGRVVNVRTWEEPLTEHDYNFTVTSADQTIVKVEDKSRLKVTTQDGMLKAVSSVDVTVTLNDTKGKPYKIKKLVSKSDKEVVEVVKEDFTKQVTVNVVQNVKSGYLLLDEGYGKFVNDGDEITVSLSELTTNNGQYLFGFKLNVLSDTDLYYEAVANVTCNKLSYIEKDKTHSNILRIKPEFAMLTDKRVKITILTDLLDAEGNAFVMQITVNFEA